MQQQAIFGPFFGMFLLTFIVWIYMYVLRIKYIIRQKIKPANVSTQEEMSRLLPAKINNPSNNLKNLFELPVLFYALCIYLFVTSQVDSFYVYSAYTFTGFRFAHSFIQCTSNKVPIRFIFYIVSALILWFLIFRALWTFSGFQ